MATHMGRILQSLVPSPVLPLILLTVLASGSDAADHRGSIGSNGAFSVTLTPRSSDSASAGGRYRLWADTALVESLDLIFADGFESGDTSAWGESVELPSGAIIFVTTSTCPTGWSELNSDRGRFVVGLPAGGQAGGTLNTPVSDLYPPIHNHTIEIQQQTTTQSPHYHRWSDLGTNAAWTTFAESGSTVTMIDWDNGIDNSGSGYFPFAANLGSHFETNVAGSHAHALDVDIATLWEDGSLPYIQLLLCRKN